MTAIEIDPSQWHQLVADLVAAAHDPADPETAIKELLCAHVMPSEVEPVAA